MFNLLTPLSYRVRLAMIDYVEEDGRPLASRYGFFIEDIDDVAAQVAHFLREGRFKQGARG